MSGDELEQDEGRPAREAPGAVERFAQGFSLPVVLLALVGGAITGWVTRAPEAIAVAATPPGPGPGPGPGPAEPPGDDPGPAEVGGAPSRGQVEALLERGQARQAQEQAEAGGFADLVERAKLLRAFTDNVVLGAWGQADAALRVTLQDGKTVLGVLQREAGETLELETWDGEKLALAKPTIQSRQILRGAEKDQALGQAVRAAREALGAAPSGLSVHRLAFLALRGGDPADGTGLLIEALRSNEGRILVDMFGSGDFALLHRAREAMAGGAATTVPVAPPPPPPDEPVATVPDPVEPPPEPIRPRPSGDPLERDADWRRTEALYREGLGLFRQAFGASPQAGAPLVKGALRRFQQAQELLERLLDKYQDEARVEQRMMELNTLVLDCNKRLGTD